MKFGPGSTIADRYYIECNLGSGGMGTVFKARDTVLDIMVAVKILHDDTDETAIVRFQREAKTSGQLNHPHIATTIDFAQTKNGISYLVMDLIEGISLEEFVSSGEQVSLEKKLELFRQISSAMEHAHSKGILHRDLKPSNVIVSESPSGISAAIVDFGLAKPIEDAGITQAGVGMGSPLYMSPEQVRGEFVDEKSDLYSFGCLMYKTLTGRPPHKGESLMETLNLHTNEKAPSIDQVSDIVYPEELVSLVDDCLERNYEDRIDSFIDLSSKLKPIVHNLSQASDFESQKDIISKDNHFDKADANENNTGHFWKSKSQLLIIAALGCFLFVIAGVSLNYMFNEDKTTDGLEKVGKTFEYSKIDDKNKLENADQSITSIDKKSFLLLDSKIVPKVKFDRKNLRKVKVMNIADKDMAEVKQTLLSKRRFSNLSISLSNLSSKGIAEIADIRKLEKISFKSTRLDRQSYKILSQMNQLQYLGFDDSKGITVDNLKQLSSLSNLQVLSLANTGIGDEHLAVISNIPNLYRLDIGYGVNISADGLRKLLKMKNLKRLNIDSSYSDKEFLELYPKFERLEQLEFECVEPLPRDLMVSLRKKMPNCSIKQDQIKRKVQLN